MMKKTLALLLAVLMVLPMMVFTTAAEETTSAAPTIIPFATGADLTFQDKYFYEAHGRWEQDVADSATKTTSYDADEKALRVDIDGPFSTAGAMMFKYSAHSGYTYDLTDMNYLCFDLYVSDTTATAAMPMELELRAPGGYDDKEAVYRPSLRALKGETLVNGWNHFEIPLTVFGSTLTEDIRSQVNYMRLYNRTAEKTGYEGETLTMMMRNVYFSDTSLKAAPEKKVGNYYYLENNNAVGKITANINNAHMTFMTPVGVEKGLDLRGYEFLEMDIWIGHEALNNLKFTWEMNASGSYDGGQDTNGDGVFRGEGDGPDLYEAQFHETVEQASGTKLVAGEWTTVRIPLARWKSSNWDYTNWRWFRMYSNPFADESLGDATYAYRISAPRFVRYEEDSLVYACEDSTCVNGESVAGWDVSLSSSGPANAIQKPWFDDIDGDGDKEWVLIHVPANDEDPASASGYFYANGGYGKGDIGIKSGFTAYSGAFNRQDGSVKAIEFDLYIASNGVDVDAAAGTAPTAEQATDSILDRSFNFNLRSQTDYTNNFKDKQNPQTLRTMFGSDLRLNDWNRVRLEVASDQGKIYTSAGLDLDQLTYIRIFNAAAFGYYNGITIAIDDFRIICDYGEEEPETVTPGGQSEVLTLNAGTASYSTNGNDKSAYYNGHTNAYQPYRGASVSDATKSEQALYFDYFYPNTVKSNTQAGNGTQWASRNHVTLAQAFDASAYDTICFDIGWDVDPDISDAMLSRLLGHEQWCFEVRSNDAGKSKDTEERQWTKPLSYYVPGLTNDAQGKELFKQGGTYHVELVLTTGTFSNDKGEVGYLNHANIKHFGAFLQQTDVAVGPNDGVEIWIDNIYFKDSKYVAPDVEPETPVVKDYLTMGATPTLDDTFNLDFQVNLLDGMNTSVTPVLDITFDGVYSRVAPVVKNGATVYPFYNIFAHRMADTINLSTYAIADNGSMVWENSTYSIKDYCSRMLEKTDDAKLKDLLSATLRYGAAAQTYAAYNEGNLATNGAALTDAPIFDVANVTKLDSVLSREYDAAKDTYKWRGATLVLGNAMALRYSFRAESTDGLTVTYTNGTTTATVDTFTEASDSIGKYFYFDVPVFANEFDSVFTVSFDGVGGADGYDMSYSVNHYVATKYDPALKKTAALLESIYNYGVAADAYTAQ